MHNKVQNNDTTLGILSLKNHLGFLNLNPDLSTRAYSILDSIENAATAAWIRSRDLRVSSRVP